MNKPVMWPQGICGFSLVEIITTVSLASILLAVGIPSFQVLIQSNRMTAAINTVTTHLNLARIEAVKRGIDVVLCPSADGDGCSNTVRWDTGFIVYVDNNKNRELDQKEQILRHINFTSDSIHINSTPGRKKTVYNPYGYVNGYNLTITFCDINDKVDPKAVIISNGGRARLSPTNADGNPLNCNYN